MKIFRAAVVGAVASLSLLGLASAEVRSINPTQQLPKPSSPTFYLFGQDVAIDGGYIIVLAAFDGGQSALLYRRNNDTGNWVYLHTLLTVNPAISVRASVRMKNGIAVVQFGSEETIFEHVGGDYVRAQSTAPLQHPGGIAISGDSILIGGNDCDYDAVIYQKGADGKWDITGRMNDHQGTCRPEGLSVALSYDIALLQTPASHETRAWHRNGNAVDWVPYGTLTISSDVGTSYNPFTLYLNTAVAPTSKVFRNNNGVWTQTGTVVPVNYGNGAGLGFDVVYRDGVLITTESVIYAAPYIYLETAPGQFTHVATVNASDLTMHHDVSGKTVVAAVQYFDGSHSEVEVSELPAQLIAPKPIVNDFDDRDISDFSLVGGQFALATRGTHNVLAQSATSGLAVALLKDSDWTDYQRVEADIAPTFNAGGSWVGLVARYLDSANYNFAVIRRDNTFSLYRRLNNVNTLLKQGTFYAYGASTHAVLTADGSNLSVSFNNTGNTAVKDTSLSHGRAGLITWQARADFDDVRVASADLFVLLENDYSAYGAIYGRPFTEIGGHWHVLQDEQYNNDGLIQDDTSGDAVSFTGVPVENQEIIARMRLNSFASSSQGAWFGLLARYVDAQNHYYVTVRSTNQIQIRKIVNGVITVLASASFTPQTTKYQEFRFRVINDQLQLFVDDVMIASAHDHDIAKGQYGLETYRTSATWESMVVLQP